MNQKIVLGGGCFWCTEAAFKEVEGVTSVTSGYAGGRKDDPSYREVCSGDTGHAEVVKIEYNEEKLDLEKILELFFRIHDPTTRNREGPDVGSQYRSMILYHNEEEKDEIEAFIEDKKKEYENEIVTEVKELIEFFPAEDKHQDYFEKNPEDAYCRIHAKPKMDKVREMEEES